MITNNTMVKKKNNTLQCVKKMLQSNKLLSRYVR